MRPRPLIADPPLDAAHSLTLAAAEGCRRAEEALERIARGCSDPDLLMRALLNLHAEDGRTIPPSPRLRAFARSVQKFIERSEP